ncbi:MAG: cell surface protein SprA [Candidatus Cloacimonadota bacterium]|nr:cell surface protein SprA [Candidatus Cloacimonadota bacterium]
MFKRNIGFIIFLVFFSVLYIALNFKPIIAEPVHELVDEEIEDTLVLSEVETIKIDSSLVLQLETLVDFPDSSEEILDTLEFVDTVLVTIIDTNYIPVDTTHYIHFPYILNKRFSHPLITTGDTTEVSDYLYRKAYPREKLKFPFFQLSPYKYADEINFDEEYAVLGATFFGVDYISKFRIPYGKYMNLRAYQTFQAELYAEIMRFAKETNTQGAAEGIIPDIEFPKIKMPKTMRKFFGDNIGRLRVSGYQKITISGRTTVDDPPPIEEGYKKSLFPDLSMKQELNLGINGTIGDKIHVSVEQSSEQTFMKKNQLNIKYVGDEDDPIKLIEGGDTGIQLSGSEFVSYSASSEGLFGVKGEFEFGNLSLKTILSQQEGQHASAHTTGSSVSNVLSFKDMDFANNHFFLYDPQTLFGPDIDSTYIGGLVDETILPKDGTLRVFVDNHKQDPEDFEGHDLEGNVYQFHELIADEEFIINYNYPYLIKVKQVYNDYEIGVVFTAKNETQIGSAIGSDITVKMIKKNYDDAGTNLDSALWNYLAKEIYFLGATNIDPQDFGVKIFLERPGSGERVEGLTVDSTFVSFIDMLGLDTNNDNKVNSSDNTVDLSSGTIAFKMLEPFKNFWFENGAVNYDSIWVAMTNDHLGNDIIYDELDPDEADFNPFFIEVSMKTSSSRITLNNINIIEGSEKVYVDNELMTKGVDYDIDYMSGIVTLRGNATVDPDAIVKVDYEYRPIFSPEKKSMIGMQAKYKFSDNASASAVLMYESEKASDKHPKIGAEPKNILVGAVTGSVDSELPFLTNTVNLIPFVRTDANSNISFSGEMAMSVPNPNTTDDQQAYIDDMEGVVETLSLGINRADWNFSSFPEDIDTTNYADNLNKSNRGSCFWYNPQDKYVMEELYPDLEDEEKAQDVPVLELKMKPIQSDSFPNQSTCWGGLMKAMGNNPVDLSEKKYLNLVFRGENVIEGDSLFINLGFINEDYYPIFHPNGELDEEDGINGNLKDGELDAGEDIGLDITSGTDPKPPKDHRDDGHLGEADDGNDDYWYSSENKDDFRGINGTEGNERLDTEDLNHDNSLNTYNAYLQYHIDLHNINDEIIYNEYNGWKFIRIPLQDSTYYKQIGSGSVSFKMIKYSRIWLRRTDAENPNFNDSLVVDFESIEVEGNKWMASAIMDTSLHAVTNPGENESFEIAAINSQTNVDYTPAPGSEIDDNISAQDIQFEQSVMLKCKNLKENRYVYARQNFIDPMKLLQYKKIKFWVYGQKSDSVISSDEEIIVFRLGADTNNYYEYRDTITIYDDLGDKMEESRWQDITIDFTQFSELKKNNFPDTTAHFRIYGNPNLNNTKQVIIGLIRPYQGHGSSVFTGRILFDDIRVADPYRDIGTAARLSINTKFADFAQVTANFYQKSPNFYTIGESAGSGNKTINYNVNNKLYLHKFFPDYWGLNFPIRYEYSQTNQTPMYIPNSDIKMTTEAEKDSCRIFSENKLLTLSLSKSKNSENPFVHYLVDNLSLSGRIQKKKNESSSLRDTTVIYSGNLNYTLGFGNKGIKILKGFKIFYLPQSIALLSSYHSSSTNKWRNQTGEGFVREESDPTEKLSPKITVAYELFSDFKTGYSLESKRDLKNKYYSGNSIFGIETDKNQDVDVNFAPGLMRFISLSTNYQGDYSQNRKEVTANDSIVSYFNVQNSRNASVNFTLKFGKWGQNLIDLSKIKKKQKKEPESPEHKKPENEKEKTIPGNPPRKPEKGISGNYETTGFTSPPAEPQPEPEQEPSQISGKTIEDTTAVTKVDETLDSLNIQNNGEEEESSKELSFPIYRRASSLSGQVAGFLLKIIGSTKCDYKNSFNTKYKLEPDSLPNINYQIGFSELDYGEVLQNSQTDKISVNAGNRFNIFKTLSSKLKTSFSHMMSNNSGNKSKTIDFEFPNVSLTYTGMDQIIPGEFMRNTTMNTGFSRKITNSGEGWWDEPVTITTIYQMNPILNLSTKFWKKLDSRISCNYSYSFTETKKVPFSKNKSNQITITGHLGYSFRNPRGLKILFLKRLRMTNELTTSLDVSYNTNIQKLKLPENPWSNDTNSTTLKIDPRFSYNFSRDIDGGLSASYKIVDNKKDGKKITTTEISLWVKFKF